MQARSDEEFAPRIYKELLQQNETNAPMMKVKADSEKVRLKLNIQKTKIITSSPITSWEIDGETMETVRLYFWELQNHCRW